ncbi:hypothetical protein C0J52_24748, partial [Blattella germanica]
MQYERAKYFTRNSTLAEMYTPSEKKERTKGRKEERKKGRMKERKKERKEERKKERKKGRKKERMNKKTKLSLDTVHVDINIKALTLHISHLNGISGGDREVRQYYKKRIQYLIIFGFNTIDKDKDKDKDSLKESLEGHRPPTDRVARFSNM